MGEKAGKTGWVSGLQETFGFDARKHSHRSPHFEAFSTWELRRAILKSQTELGVILKHRRRRKSGLMVSGSRGCLVV